VEVVRLNEQVRDFAKSEDENGRKDTYNKHFFQRSIVEKLGYFPCSPPASTEGFLGKLRACKIRFDTTLFVYLPIANASSATCSAIKD
jgi:hypothetical protein